jgi:hypothetical protein
MRKRVPILSLSLGILLLLLMMLLGLYAQDEGSRNSSAGTPSTVRPLNAQTDVSEPVLHAECSRSRRLCRLLQEQ